MIVVIDTNVYLSHFRFGGLPTRVCLFCMEETDVFISDFIINETLRVLTDKFSLSEDQLAFVSQTIQQSTLHTVPTNPMPTTCRDPDDNNVLQLAQFVRADYLITGDRDLLTLGMFDSCQIMTPKAFAELVNLS